jgi:hypothetical protein
MRNALSAIACVGAIFGSSAQAEPQERTARCDIVLDDVMRGSKMVIRETFYVSSQAVAENAAERRYFGLPGVTDGECTLAFFPKNGTMVSCQMDALGLHYVQSDRSAIEEFPNRNQLTFRLEDVHVSIEVSCAAS